MCSAHPECPETGWKEAPSSHNNQITINLCSRDTRVKLMVVSLVRGILFLIICLCAASGEPQLAGAARWGLAQQLAGCNIELQTNLCEDYAKFYDNREGFSWQKALSSTFTFKTSFVQLNSTSRIVLVLSAACSFHHCCCCQLAQRRMGNIWLIMGYSTF